MTTIKYPSRSFSGRSVSSLAQTNNIDIKISTNTKEYKIFNNQLMSISPIDVMSYTDVIAEFEVDVNGQIIKDIREIVENDDFLKFQIDVKDHNNNISFIIELTHAMIESATISSKKDLDNDELSNMALVSFDQKTPAQKVRVLTRIAYENIKYTFPNIKP